MTSLQSAIIKADNEELYCEYSLAKENTVIMHGAGTAQLSRYHELANIVLERGKGVILFDFSGHGKSSGTIAELSLSRRVKQAQAVIDALAPTGTIYLAGFSMSGQTACDLLPIYESRIKSVLLGCAAAYRPDIADIPFGSDEFTMKLRQGEWQNTTSKVSLRSYQGHTVIAIGAEDTVIPKGVTQLLKEAATNISYIEYPGAGHSLTTWLSDHAKEQRELVDTFLN